jgi:hypothetical protein
VNGNNGGKALFLATSGSAMISLPYRNSVIMGFRVKFDNVSVSARLLSSAGVGLSRALRDYFTLDILQDGSIVIYAGDEATILGTSGDFKVHQDTYYYFEIKYTTSSSTDMGTGKRTVVISSPTVRIDGTTRITGTGGSAIVDETDWITPAGNIDTHRFFGTGTTVNGTLIQDLYIFDNQGGINVDFAGDSRMGCIFPRADIDTDWTPSSGSAHFSLVNEHICDDDATYVSSDTAGDQDEYNFDNVTVVADIVAAQFLFCAKKDDEGVRSIKGTMNTLEFTDEQFVNDSYVYYRKPFDVHPPENAATFNARTWGIKVIS